MRHRLPNSLSYEGGKERSHVNVVEFNESFQSDGPGDVTPDPEVVGRAVRRRFSAAYRQQILAEVDAAAGKGAVGRILRREGLYSSALTSWRKARAHAERLALEPKKRGPKPTPENPLQAENTKLQRENTKLHQKLRTAELMIDLQKKVSQLLGITLPVLEQSDDDEVNS